MAGMSACTEQAFRPETLAGALRILAEQPCLPMAGGTDLMVRHRPAGGTMARFPRPLLAIGHLPELQGIRERNGCLEIGAACTLAAFLESPLVPEGWKPPVAAMASPAIRNVGSIGGNVMNASPAGDTLPMLVALDATVRLAAADGLREMPMAAFITGPGTTERRPEELLVAVRVPVPVRERRYWYRKVGQRQANCLSKVSLFGWWEGAGTVTACGVAIGAVAPVVVRHREAEAVLAGMPSDSRENALRGGPAHVLADARASAPEGESKQACFLRMVAPLIRPIDDRRSTADYRREVALRLLAAWLATMP